MVAWRLAMESVILAGCVFASEARCNNDEWESKMMQNGALKCNRPHLLVGLWGVLGSGAAGAAPDVLLEASVRNTKTRLHSLCVCPAPG